MHDDELNIKLHNYFDELLSPEEEVEFQTLLMENRTLAIELGKLKDLKRRLKNLPLSFDPPPRIISNITDKLMSQERISSKNEQKVEKTRSNLQLKKEGSGKKNKLLTKFLYILIALLIIISTGYYYYYYYMESTTPWRVNITKGDARIGYSVNASNISENQVLELVENSEAEIYLNDLAVISVNNKAKLKILSANRKKNIIDFIIGNMEYTPKPGSIIFETKVRDLSIISTNSKFRISTDRDGAYQVQIINNFLNLQSEENSYRFPRDNIIIIDAKRVLRTPFNINASQRFIKLLEEFDYKKGSETFDKIIASASKKDAFSLYSLLSKVTPPEREQIIEKLDSLVPLPYSVNKRDILILNHEMMEKWWDEIYRTI